MPRLNIFALSCLMIFGSAAVAGDGLLPIRHSLIPKDGEGVLVADSGSVTQASQKPLDQDKEKSGDPTKNDVIFSSEYMERINAAQQQHDEETRQNRQYHDRMMQFWLRH